MSGTRPWGIAYRRQVRGAPFLSLGIHIDLHTPRVELFLPRSCLSIGRIRWWGDRWLLPLDEPGPWNGHSDDCDHPR